MEKKLTCIRCPFGCSLVATYNENFENIEITGNRCPRGVAYAKQELTNPCRTVTAVVKTNSKIQPYISVRTNKELAKSLIAPLLNQIYKMEVKVPAKRGDILIKNYENSQIDVILTSTVKH